MTGRIDSAAVVKVIRVTHSTGEGTQRSLARMVDEFWSEDGELLAVADPAPALGDLVQALVDGIERVAGADEIVKASAMTKITDLVNEVLTAPKRAGRS